MTLMRTGLASHPTVLRVSDGASAIDVEDPYYFGYSNGAIMGTAYMSLSPDVMRGQLDVGGGPYIMLVRSHTLSLRYVSLGVGSWSSLLVLVIDSSSAPSTTVS